MNVVIVGSGNMGSALASQLVKAGHQVSIVSKDAAHATALAKKVGAQAVPAVSAASNADIVIVATPQAEAAGPLRNARYLEPLAALNIYFGYGADKGTSIAPTWIARA